ncbi:MAG: hypothetical protein KAS05_02280 [Candidatus Omnitrophica bacterium]|nr:hypothetical protein [Candidatus Omnitrophota bacterium]
MVVCVIVSVLATIGLLAYRKVIIKAKAGRARNALSLIAQAEEIWRIDNNGAYRTISWGQTVNPRVGTAQTGVNLRAVDSDPEFAYRVTAAGMAQARNKVALGACPVNRIIQLNLVSGAWAINWCYR